ncbi:type II toxin-antitoxin system RelE/ParE family toxin [Fulvimarina sp. 2208YS6-2-32]|uniref:Type II toxin-antitoxin system RelE/ParE family toxin n=1 Tax=Fulvimarina uroteuthidis TaxID=3098149 RepID=A0ABU5I5B0_9HYPH|nr:type II toxin-antitoxin system RelE/ParE family toxin [Fulvimarina sp. 2208YS6-2-32]MDY8110277.1 type II toxin-antitoxin system RelE/ParE family toxin [Fulvimarina sp. 2208YS6-2-32]
MIRSFHDKQAETIARGKIARKLPGDMQRTALKTLRQLDAAAVLDDVRIPPGNRLEALQGDRSGQYSIRINDQWRICFRWDGGHADDVEIVDYH